MKQLTMLLVALLATVTLSAQIRTPAPSPNATVTQTVGLAKVTVEYSRPSVKGRKIFGDLVPFGKVWRTGANKITTIKFDQPLTINGKSIPAGSYGWYTFPSATAWTVALNSDDKQWGAYEYDEKKDVLRISVVPEKMKQSQEHLGIAFEKFTTTSADLVLRWEKTAIRLQLVHDPHPQIMEQIASTLAKPDAKADDYYAAAEYYRDKNIDLPQAYAWANKVLETEKMWWSYYLRASIAAKMGKCAEAVADAKISIEGARKDNDTAYVKMNEKILKQCGQ